MTVEGTVHLPLSITRERAEDERGRAVEVATSGASVWTRSASRAADLEAAPWHVEDAGSPAPRLIRREAVSRRSPVGLPFASLRISPPSGFFVVRETPESFIASALTKLAWPLACVSNTGFAGDTRLSEASVGNPSTLGDGGVFHFS